MKRLLALALLFASTVALASQVQVGSKKFTESVIVGDIASQWLVVSTEDAVKVRHRREIGGTRVLFEALKSGEIDVYAEYTGTLRLELLTGKVGPNASDEELRAALKELGLGMTDPLGFNNTYAIGVPEELASKRGIDSLSDLAQHPDLRLAFSTEFMQRSDGWPALQKAYTLRNSGVRGLDHDLAYRAIQERRIDATDLYSTDAEIRSLKLRALVDDRKHFPDYQAFFLYRLDLAQKAPGAIEALEKLAGTIDQQAMIDLNARAKIDGQPEPIVAADFLEKAFGLKNEVETETLFQRLWMHTLEHLELVAISLGAALLLGIPLGIGAARNRQMGQLILAIVGVIQTIPSLALLVFTIPLLGIGSKPAICALFLYSLLPIVRGTHAGLHGVSPELKDVSKALGLPKLASLLRIELPLASPSILSGVKTAAVINIGTATLGALIGAGGYGQPILTGIRLADTSMILEGAIPAAVLALVVQSMFELLELVVVPKGLRLKARG